MVGHGSNLLVVVTAVLFVPAAISFALRVYVRLSRGSWGLDDWALTFAFPLFIWLTQSAISGGIHGIGTHMADLTDEQIMLSVRDFWMLQAAVCPCIWALKFSIALTLLRIATGRPNYIRLLYAVIASFTLTIAVVFVFVFVNCQPISFSWDKRGNGKCLPPIALTTISFIYSSVNILTDWVLAIMPLPLIWEVQMKANAKIAAIGLLSMGAFASICGVVRLAYTVNLLKVDDYPYNVLPVTIWAYAEVAIGIITICCSTLRPLLSKMLRLDSSFKDSTTNGAYTAGGTSRSRVQNLTQQGPYELQSSKKSGAFTTTVSGGHIEKGDSGSDIGDADSERGILPGTIKMTTEITRDTSTV